MDEAVLIILEEAAHSEHGMAIHASAVAAISASVTSAAVRKAAAARERRDGEAAAREDAAAREPFAAREAITSKEAVVRALEEALAQGRAQKEAEERAHADAVKQEALETAQRKVAKEKAGTEAAIRAFEAEMARLQQEREEQAVRDHEEAKRRAAEATLPAMEETEMEINRGTRPGGPSVDIHRRLFEGDSASRMKTGLDAEDSQSSNWSGRAARQRRKGKWEDPRKGHRGPPRSTPTTSTSLSPAATKVDETAGIADSPRAARWEWPEQAVEEAVATLRVRMERVCHLLTAAGEAPRVDPAEVGIPMKRHGDG